MNRILVTAAALGIVLAAGCQTNNRRAPYADNPLVMSRQPLIKRPSQDKNAGAVAQTNTPNTLSPPVPLPPSPPASLVQSPPRAPAWDTPTGPALAETQPSTSVPAALQPLPARPIADADSTQPPTLPTAPVVMPASAVRTVQGKYAHSHDHTWLQGELDRHYRGYLDLRFRPATDEDSFGGKVRLEDDPRLAEFRAGDVIAVEGEIVREADRAMGQYPRYRIRDVKLVERK